MIELLAPAKDKECAKAAIDFGADAVYIGAEEFGARKSVPNSVVDIKEVVDYAHKFNAKVYVTINTILTDKEIERAENLIKKLSKINVDALIVQDMGLLNAAKANNMEIHASTQCDIRTAEKVNFLEKAGFLRVVLARELSIEQIKEIKSQTNVELEVFIHGALCVSYSGQCYLSYAIGGRSANRGECAQPCRKTYSLVDEDGKFIAKNKHLLCLKDFNAAKYLKKLAETGVSSFKIEGRLKDVNYVKNIVGYYRKLIDELKLGKTSSGKVFFDFEPNPEKSFNRGFCDYFLEGRKKCFSFDSPKSKGQYVGRVSKTAKDFFEIKTDKKLSSQDGLCFFDKENISGCLVNKIEKNRIYPNKMPKISLNAEVYRNFDVDFEKQLRISKTYRKIITKIKFGLNKISITDEDKNFVEMTYDFEEFAQNEDKMKANIINQFQKSGESEFLVENIEIRTDKIPFLPVSKINELRRKLFEQLSIERQNSLKKKREQEKTSAMKSLQCSQPEPSAIFNQTFDYKEVNVEKEICEKEDFGKEDFKNIDCENANCENKACNIKGGKENACKLDYRANVLNAKAKKFYEDLGFIVKEMGLESGLLPNGKIVMDTKHCLKYAFNMCKSPKKLFLIDEKGKKYELKFNCKKCEMEIIY